MCVFSGINVPMSINEPLIEAAKQIIEKDQHSTCEGPCIGKVEYITDRRGGMNIMEEHYT